MAEPTLRRINEDAIIKPRSYFKSLPRAGEHGRLRLMNVRIIRKLKPLLVVLGWATSTAALALATIFQGQLLPKNINGGGLYGQVVNASPLPIWIFYVGNFAVCVVAAMVISDPARSLVSYFPSFIGAAAITYLVLALPDFVGAYDPQQVLQDTATIFTFTAFFPLLLLVNLAGTVVGIAVGERLL
jgi:hypothetical protein